MRTLSVLLTILLSGCATTAGNDWTRFADGSLNEWLDDEAVPALSQTFSQHPRFRAETIRVAALDGVQVSGRSNGLTTAVRDSLHSALLQHPGLDIALADGPERCTMVPIDGYYLAVEATPSGARGANVQLRVFDIVEQQWVSGFAFQWRGDLSAAQRGALGRSVVADSARGLRVLPFAADESDLVAARLAADLACQLRRAGNDELTVVPARDQGAALIAGNLAGKHKIPVAADGVLELETRAHRVDEQLYQVWAILTPTTPSDELSSVTTSVYATRPLLKAAAPAARQPVVPAMSPAAVVKAYAELLSPLRVIGMTSGCRDSRWHNRAADLGERPVIAPGGCFGLAFERHPQTQLYIISHQVDATLERLYPARCTRNAVDSRDAAIRFPDRRLPLPWDSRSGTQTLYVIVARGSRATHRLERLISRLPDACKKGDAGEPVGPRWLSDIDSTVNDLGSDVAWQAVRVYHQPRTASRLAKSKELYDE
ncbi:MAG: hypothetical protein KJO66_03260 [Gammaproteobacteria bacterium]|nr:hypothetical protein [Gammaproteobacteria bacterium]